MHAPNRLRDLVVAAALATLTTVAVGTFGPSGAVHADTADDVIACPIPTGSEFIDSWGAARSGGRRHQGVDMITGRGTPVVAAQSGDIEFKQNRLGGNAAWLHSPNGNTFYYAHFADFEGESRTVVQGEIIGYVGSTGNAQGPHLHFETHFDGSVGNPFPAVHTACDQAVIDALQAAVDAALAEAAIHGEFKISSRTVVADASGDVVAGTNIRR